MRVFATPLGCSHLSLCFGCRGVIGRCIRTWWTLAATASARPAPHRRRDEWQQQATTSGVRSLGASWDAFSDPQSNISSYYVQFWAQGNHPTGNGSAGGDAAGGGDGGAGLAAAGAAVNLTDLINVGLKNRWGAAPNTTETAGSCGACNSNRRTALRRPPRQLLPRCHRGPSVPAPAIHTCCHGAPPSGQPTLLPL